MIKSTVYLESFIPYVLSDIFKYILSIYLNLIDYICYYLNISNIYDDVCIIQYAKIANKIINFALKTNENNKNY